MMVSFTLQLVLHFMVFLASVLLTNAGSGAYVSDFAFRQLYERANKKDTSFTTSDIAVSPKQHSLTSYDQRQNGRYNIHVNVKDVKIVAVDDDNLEENLGDDMIYDYGDYDYDPAHLTVNPLPIFGSGISTVSITSTSKPSNQPSEVSGPGTTISGPSTSLTQKPSTITASNPPMKSQRNEEVQDGYQEIPVAVIEEPVFRPKQLSSIHPTSHDPNHKPQQRRNAIGCFEGEYRDYAGNCRGRRSGIQKLYDLSRP